MVYTVKLASTISRMKAVMVVVVTVGNATLQDTMIGVAYTYVVLRMVVTMLVTNVKIFLVQDSYSSATILSGRRISQ